MLGAVTFSPEQLERELEWIDRHVDDNPLLHGSIMPIPARYDEAAEATSSGVPAATRFRMRKRPSSKAFWHRKACRNCRPRS